MKSKTTALILAIVLGLLATFGLIVYLRMVTEAATSEGRKIRVFTAKEKLSPGKTMDEMVAGGQVVKKSIPRRYLPRNIVTSVDQLNGRVLAVSISKGDQLTTTDFKSVEEKGALPLKLKKDQLAITVPVDEFTGVGGEINPGDKVVIFASFEGPTEEAAFTQILLTDVEVLSVPVQKKESKTSTSRPGKEALMVAIKPHEAEKLVFATENGKIWAALQAGDAGLETTASIGANLSSVFQ